MAVLARWLLFTGILGAIGSLVVAWGVLPRAADLADAPPDGRQTPQGAPQEAPQDARGHQDLHGLRTRLAGYGTAAGLLTLLALGLLFWAQFRAFRDPFATWREDLDILMGTSWGGTWAWGVRAAGLATLGFLALGMANARAQRGLSVVVGALTLVAVGALAFFPAFTGHAVGSERLMRQAVGADVLHVAAAGAWVGGLGMILLLEIRNRREDATARSLLPGLIPAFSPIALGGASVIVATGLFAAWLHLPDWASLWTSGYGRLLLAKVGLVAGVAALGALNWRRLTPVLTQPEGPGRLRRTAGVEWILMQVVLVVTAFLVGTAPPPVG